MFNLIVSAELPYNLCYAGHDGRSLLSGKIENESNRFLFAHFIGYIPATVFDGAAALPTRGYTEIRLAANQLFFN